MEEKFYIFHQFIFYKIKVKYLQIESFFPKKKFQKIFLLNEYYKIKNFIKKKFKKIEFFLKKNFFLVKKFKKYKQDKKLIPEIKFQKKNFYFNHKYFRELIIASKRKNEKYNKKLSVKYLPLLIKYFFKNLKRLNYIQSTVFSRIYGTDLNIMIVSPTGSGKTLLASFGILRIFQNSLVKKRNKYFINKKNFCIIFVAPLKTLVKEIIKNFNNFFCDLFLEINEMTGDEKIKKKKIFCSNIVVGTPQKMYFFFKKFKDEKFLRSIKLILVDEIHLLNEKRGAILEEFLVGFLSSKKLQKRCRVIGMSATLPNFLDVARFLNVNFLKGLFFFGSSFKVVYSIQTLIGIKNLFFQKNILNILNEITFSKIELFRRKKKNFGVIIFVQSRRDTVKTALSLLKKEKNNIASNNDFKKLNNILKKEKIGLHHGGLSRKNRLTMENSFRNKKINILISTTTLAWGVNLPVTDIIIKGTKVYSPEFCKWSEVSDLNIIQMMGRAGRSSFSNNSEALLITSIRKLSHYFSLLTFQLPIESQLLVLLPDSLNNLCVRKRKLNIKEIFNWFSKTFFFTRLSRYILSSRQINSEKTRNKVQKDLKNKFVNSMLNELESIRLISFGKNKKFIYSTKIGLIISKYSLNYQTFLVLFSKITPDINISQLLEILSSSKEFSRIIIRKGEEKELARLMNLAIFPVKLEPTDPLSKTNILIQSFIGNLRIFKLSLIADSIFIAKTFSRILKAVFQMGIIKRWNFFTNKSFDLYKAFQNQKWPFYFSFEAFFHKNHTKKYQKKTRKMGIFPPKNRINKKIFSLKTEKKREKKLSEKKKELQIQDTDIGIQPITRNVLKISVIFRMKISASSLINQKIGFWAFLGEEISDTIISYKYFSIKKKKNRNFLVLNFFLPLFDNPFIPFFTLKIKSFHFSFDDFEKTIDLTKILLPFNHPIKTGKSGFKRTTFSRILSGLDFGDILSEYYETHNRKINGFFYQMISFILKSESSSILSFIGKKIKFVFSEFSIFSFLNRKILYNFLTFSSGFESFSLKSIKLKKSSLSILGFSIKRIGKKCKRINSREWQKNCFYVQKSLEINSSKNTVNKKKIQNLVLLIDDLHFIGNKNFGNTYETSINYFLKKNKIGKKINFIGTIFNILNLKEFLTWMKLSDSQIFSFDFGKKIGFMNNGSRKEKFKIKIKKNFQNISWRKEEENYYSGRLFLNLDVHSLKKNFLNLIGYEKFFYNFSYPKEIYNFNQILEGLKFNSKKLVVFLTFKTGFLVDYWAFFKKKVILEFFIGKKILNLGITISTLGIIDGNQLSSRKLYIKKLFLEKKFPKFLFSERFFFLERFKFLCLNFDNNDNFLKIMVLKIFPLESTFNSNFKKKLSIKMHTSEDLSFKKTARFFFLTYFSERITQNPQFYGIKNFGSFIKVLRKKFYKSKKIIIKNKNFLKHTSKFFIQFFSFFKKTSILFLINFKNFSISKFFDKLIFHLKEFWLIKIFGKWEEYKDKNFLFINFLFKNKENFSEMDSCNSNLLIHEKLKNLWKTFLVISRKKLNLRMLLYSFELFKVSKSKLSRTRYTKLKNHFMNKLDQFRYGKIHQKFFLENFMQILHSSNKLNISKKSKKIRKILFSIFFLVNFFFRATIEKKQNKTFMFLKLDIFEKKFFFSKFYFFFSKTISSEKKKYKWMIIVGNLEKNELFFIKKFTIVKRNFVGIRMSLNEKLKSMQLFMINNDYINFDRELDLEFFL